MNKTVDTFALCLMEQFQAVVDLANIEFQQIEPLLPYQAYAGVEKGGAVYLDIVDTQHLGEKRCLVQKADGVISLFRQYNLRSQVFPTLTFPDTEEGVQSLLSKIKGTVTGFIHDERARARVEMSRRQSLYDVRDMDLSMV